MLKAFDIQRLDPEGFEFLWRTILRREHASSYKRFDGLGIDCLVGSTAYQFYCHQAARWTTVQEKLRGDLAAARQALEADTVAFSKWVFVSTFPFKEPDHVAWVDRQKAAVPFVVETWGDEDLLINPDRQADAERIIGLVTAPSRRPLVGVSCEFAGCESFLAWDGDLEYLTIEDPRVVAGEGLAAIQCAICRYASDPQQPIWTRVAGSGRQDVWQVDEQRRTRRKLMSEVLAKRGISFLTVAPRRVPCVPFCALCGRTSGGIYCPRCGGVQLRRCP